MITTCRVENKEGRGRCVVANEDIMTECIALKEAPFAMVILDSLKSTYCAHCARSCVNLCVYQTSPEDSTKYCSQTCLTMDYSIHQYELEALKIFSNMSMPVKENLRMKIDLDCINLLVRIASVKLHHMKNKSLIDTTGSSISVFADVMNLQSEESQPNMEDTFKKIAKIMNLCKLPLSIIEIRHIYSAIRCNAHHIVNDVGCSVGLGLFPLVSMLNHSCRPNCTKYFDFDVSIGDRNEEPQLIIRTTMPLLANEELVYSYVPLYQSTQARRLQLQHSYSFTCDCPRCSLDNSESETIKNDPLSEYFLDHESIPKAIAPQIDRDLASILNDYSSAITTDSPILYQAILNRCVFVLQPNSENCLQTFMPQHKLMLQLYVCILNLVLKIYGPLESLNFNSDVIHCLRFAVGVGMLALGCLQFYLGCGIVNKETADIESSLSRVCELLLNAHYKVSMNKFGSIEDVKVHQVVDILLQYLRGCEKTNEEDTSSYFQCHGSIIKHFFRAVLVLSSNDHQLLGDDDQPNTARIDESLNFDIEIAVLKYLHQIMIMRAAKMMYICRG